MPNFPSSTLGPEVIRADGVTATEMAEAILTHMPLDTFEFAETAWRMEVVGDPGAVPEVFVEFQEIVSRRAEAISRSCRSSALPLYEHSRHAAYIVATTEFRLYGNLILKKGVVHAHEVFKG